MAQKRTFDPYIELQDELVSQIHHALQGGIILQINNWCMGDLEDRMERTRQIAFGSRIDKNFMSDVYQICLDVKKTLDFDEDIEFYLTQNPEVNATAYLSMIEGKPHIINVYSGLYNLLDEDELKTILGHEIGHLINKDRWISEIMHFVYPDMEKCPLYLKRRFELYNLLAELSADRCGYLASKNLEASISTIYKLSTGVNIWKHDVDLPGMLKNNDEQLHQLLKEGIATHSTHPFDPIRIKALDVFANAKSEEELEKQMKPLIELLMEVGGSEEDRYMMEFVVTAGMFMAMEDGEATIAEHNTIIEKLGEITLSPESYFEKIVKGDVQKIYDQAVNKLINLDKEADMIRYLAEIALSDGKIDENEIIALLHFGEKLNIAKEIVARIVGTVIREQYRPLAINMSMSNDKGTSETEDPLEEDCNLTSEEIKPKFVMEVRDKTVDKSHHLMLCGKIEGVAKRLDKVIITNGDKKFEDEILGIKVRYSIVDSTEGIDPKEEVELGIKNTSLRDIDGKLRDWKVFSVETLSDVMKNEPESKPTTKSRKSRKKKSEEDEQEIEMETPEINWDVTDEERTEPKKENTLYLPMKQVFFDKIIEGSKKVEFRVITINTYKKYIQTDEEGEPCLEEELIQNEDECHNNFICPWNEGVCPFIPKDIQYLDLAVGYNTDRDTARVEVVGYSFIPERDSDGNPRRFRFDETDKIVYDSNGDNCFWVIAIHLGKVLECNRKKKVKTENHNNYGIV